MGVTVGDVLMIAAPLVATAFPFVAVGMAIAGAALWIGAKAWQQHRESIAKIVIDRLVPRRKLGMIRKRQSPM